MGSGGGGTSQSQAVNTPEMAALQQAALPEIKRMMELNPLSTYAAWQPREIAGSNPFYDQLFSATSRMGPAAQGLETIFGEPPAPTGGVPAPSSGGGLTFMGSDIGSSTPIVNSSTFPNSVPAPPAQFQPPDIQNIVQQAVQKQTQDAMAFPADKKYLSFDEKGVQHLVSDNDYNAQWGLYLDPATGEYFTNVHRIF